MSAQEKMLASIQTQLDRITRAINSPIAISPDHRFGVREAMTAPSNAPERVITAKAWIHALRARNRAFGPGLFFDPAWDMLLDLYVSRCERGLVCVSSLCIASNVPMTTALRWIATLEERELIYRTPDPFDKRRYYISLTDEGVSATEAALDGACESDRKLGVERLQRT